MGERLAGGNAAIALLANTFATGAMLVALILAFGPVSGAHFNPAVTLAEAWRGAIPWSDAPAYIGARGAKRTQAERRQRLLAAGVSEQDIARISAPVGLDLGALSPAEVAVSILAEIIAVRHGRAGGRLSARQGTSIHQRG